MEMGGPERGAFWDIDYLPFNNPLPVELTSFDATADQDRVVLAWNTATETNNAGFEIERSRDGQVFKKIGFVSGTGTTQEEQWYQYEDDVSQISGQRVVLPAQADRF